MLFKKNSQSQNRPLIDVCEGAIGWRSNTKGVEVFSLYDEAISFSGLQFIPAAVCDSVYYVDPFDRTRFIRLDCYFDMYVVIGEMEKHLYR